MVETYSSICCLPQSETVPGVSGVSGSSSKTYLLFQIYLRVGILAAFAYPLSYYAARGPAASVGTSSLDPERKVARELTVHTLEKLERRRVNRITAAPMSSNCTPDTNPECEEFKAGMCENGIVGPMVKKNCPKMCGSCDQTIIAVDGSHPRVKTLNNPPQPSWGCNGAAVQYEPGGSPLALTSMTFELNNNRSCLDKSFLGCIPPDRWHWAKGKGVLEKANMDRTYCGAMCGVAVCCEGKTFTAKQLTVIRPGLPAPAGLEAETEITLVTAGTFTRVEAVRTTIDRWKGPMVIVMYINAANQHDDAEKQKIAITDEFKDVRENIRVVYYVNMPATQKERESIAAMQALIDGNPEYTKAQRKAVNNVEELSNRYPINTMRNVALDQAATNWVLVLDMDMVPSEGLYEAMKTNHLVEAAKLYLPVLIVPHFELLTCPKTPPVVPKNMEEFVGELSKSMLRPFHAKAYDVPRYLDSVKAGLRSWGQIDSYREFAKSCPAYPHQVHGHNVVGVLQTRYDAWVYNSMLNYTGLYGVSNTKHFDYRHYEPFVAVRRVEANGKLTPRFSEYFVGRNLNKVSWLGQLHTRAFHFVVVLSDFVVHYPHKTTHEALFPDKKNNIGHSSAANHYLQTEDEEIREREGWTKLNWKDTKSAELFANMSSFQFVCPLAHQQLQLDPLFVRAVPPCPSDWPYLDRKHVFMSEHGDVCRNKPEHNNKGYLNSHPYWECPAGCKKSPKPPYCFPEPGNSNFAATIEGKEGNLRPCRIPS